MVSGYLNAIQTYTPMHVLLNGNLQFSLPRSMQLIKINAT